MRKIFIEPYKDTKYMASTKFYLDERFPKGDGTCPLRIAISHKSNTRLINIGVRLLPSEWDKTACKVISRADKNFLNAFIVKKKQAIDIEILKLLDNGRLFHLSATELKNIIVRNLELIDIIKDKCLFIPYAIENNAHRNTIAKNLGNNVIKKISNFVGTDKAKVFTFDDITLDWLKKFDLSMIEAGNSPNARATYLSQLRYFMNLAINEELTSNNVFKKFKIKFQSTAKRSLTINELRRIRDLELTGNEEIARDIFMLIFYLIGINVADLMTLKGLNNGRIEYLRAKTGKLYSIKAQKEALAIIEKYRDDSGIIGKALAGRSRTAIIIFMSKNLGRIHPGLTTYYARHTWASIASELDIPDDVISRALGHSGLTGARVTDVYINFNNKKIDEANRKVIDYLNSQFVCKTTRF